MKEKTIGSLLNKNCHIILIPDEGGAVCRFQLSRKQPGKPTLITHKDFPTGKHGWLKDAEKWLKEMDQ